MIRICERCFGQIGEHEAAVRRTHLHHTDHDGTSHLMHSYTHRYPCAAPRPDTGTWDARRSIGILRLRAAASEND
jgi:hypothetical protein